MNIILTVYPVGSSDDIVFISCDIENPGKLLFYEYGAVTAESAHYFGGTPLTGLSFENCRISGRCSSSVVKADSALPLTVRLINTVLDNDKNVSEKLFDPESENLTVEVI